MNRFVRVLALSGCGVTLLACAETPSPTALAPPDASFAASETQETSRTVTMFDACDPQSFNAVLGAGTCLRNGGMRFEEFNKQLARLQSVPAWHFDPAVLNVRIGDTFSALNLGGEKHTFTEVEHFGGGIVPVLNQASGNLVVAPECQALAASDFISPGARSDSDDADTVGDENYQCCIHPWMRTVVHVRAR